MKDNFPEQLIKQFEQELRMATQIKNKNILKKEYFMDVDNDVFEAMIKKTYGQSVRNPIHKLANTNTAAAPPNPQIIRSATEPEHASEGDTWIMPLPDSCQEAYYRYTYGSWRHIGCVGI